jgi:chromosome segregation ATPase
VRDLVNTNSPSGKMRVSITIRVCDNTSADQFKDITIERVYDSITNKTTTHLTCGDETMKRVDINKIHEIFKTYGLNLSVLSRVIVHQSSASIANSSPLELLHFLEESIGTNSLKEQEKNHRNMCSVATSLIANKKKDMLSLQEEISAMKPMILQTYQLYLEYFRINKSFCEYYSNKIKSLTEDVVLIKEENLIHKTELLKCLADQIDYQNKISQLTSEVACVDNRLNLLKNQKSKAHKSALQLSQQNKTLLTDITEKEKSLKKLSAQKISLHHKV